LSHASIAFSSAKVLWTRLLLEMLVPVGLDGSAIMSTLSSALSSTRYFGVTQLLKSKWLNDKVPQLNVVSILFVEDAMRD
jgi:hypothetical protein